jgi:predicted DCC family thiol-disulfide oxidoreductase YuxK
MTASTGSGSSALPAEGVIEKLTILYDEQCAFCLRCRDWLLAQPCFLEVELVPAGSPISRQRYGALPWLGNELVAVDDRGRVWVGPGAFLVCMWVTVRYRSWAFRLSGPSMAPLATRFFKHISKRRDRWSTWLGRNDPECSCCDQVRVERGT